jgi:hypothetical protein
MELFSTREGKEVQKAGGRGKKPNKAKVMYKKN